MWCQSYLWRILVYVTGIKLIPISFSTLDSLLSMFSQLAFKEHFLKFSLFTLKHLMKTTSFVVWIGTLIFVICVGLVDCSID